MPFFKKNTSKNENRPSSSTSFSPDSLLTTEEIIKLSQKGGADFGSGNPNERIRYFIKLGILPYTVKRLSQNSTSPIGHLPAWTIGRLIEITKLNKQGLTFPQIAQKLNSKPKSLKPDSLDSEVNKPDQPRIVVSLSSKEAEKAITRRLEKHEENIKKLIDFKLKTHSQVLSNVQTDLLLKETRNLKIPASALIALVVLSLFTGGIFISAKKTGYLGLGKSNNVNKIQEDFAKSGSVLAATSEEHQLYIDANLEVSGTALFEENITAPNVVYSVTGGTGIAVTGGQNPVVSLDSTELVTSVNDVTGAITLQGSGGTTISEANGTITITSSSSGITSEADTLSTVTGRGATTSTALTLNGNVTFGGTLTSGSSLLLDPTTYVSVGSGTPDSASGSGDLFVEDDLEIDGALIVGSSAGNNGQCLLSSGANATPTWGACAGGASSFDLDADSGTPENIAAGDTLTIAGGTGITTAVGATDTVTITATLGTAIDSSEITDGSIVNADINASAAIAYSKLNLAGSIVSADITDNTLTAADLAATLTFADGDYLDLSAANLSTTTEGLRLPQATDCTTNTTVEGVICWDTDGDSLYIGNGTTATQIGNPFGSSIDSSEITDGTITNDDISASAAIAFSKLAALTDGNILVGNGSNVAASVNPSGDVDISNTGVFTIQADSVALGTDTTGNYVATITAGGGLTGTVASEGSTPTLAVGDGTGILINADDIGFDCSEVEGTDIDCSGESITLESTIDSVSTINLSGTGTLNGLDSVDATTEDTIEALIFDADAQDISGVWEVADDTNFRFGTDANINLLYNETDDLFNINTALTASQNTDYAIYTLAADTANAGMTANQEVFEIGRGGNDDSDTNWVELFSLDEDGDGVFTGTITASNFSGSSSGTNTGDVTLAGHNYLSLSGQQITAEDVALGTHTSGNYVAAVSEGTGIDISGSAGEGWTATVNFDSTEIGNTTWGSGTGITWTFDASAGTDPTITFGNGSITLSTATVSGTLTADGTLDANGAVTLGDGGDSVTIDGSALTLQTTGAGSDITINAIDQIILTDFTNGGSGCSALETDANGFLTCGTDNTGGTASALAWDDLTAPDANLSLSMGAFNTTFTWDPTANSAETAWILNFDGEDSTGGGDEAQVLLSLVQTSNGTDVDEAADALLRFTNSDANDPVESAIDFASGTFTYGLNLNGGDFTSEIVLENEETITNQVDGTVATSSDFLISGNDLTFGNAESISNASDGVLSITSPSTTFSGDITITGNDITFGNAETISNASDGVVAITSPSTTFSGDITVSGNDITFGNNESFDNNTDGTIDVNANILNLGNNLIENIGAAGTDFTSGGGLTLAELLTVNDDVDFVFAAGENLNIDASTTANTTTGGVVDLNVAAGNAAVIGLDIDFTMNDGLDAGTDQIAQRINLTQSDVDGDLFGLSIVNNATAASVGTDDVECLLCLDNAENTAGVISDAIRITNSGGTAGAITTGIDIDTTGVTTDIELQNGESIDNDTDNQINLNLGSAGTLLLTSATSSTISNSAGDININANGGDIIFADGDTLNIGGSGDDVAFNAIGDDTANAGSVDSDNDLYIEDDLEVDGTIFGNLTGNVTGSATDLSCTDCINATEIEDIYLLNTGDTATGSYTFSLGAGETFALADSAAKTADVFSIVADAGTTTNGVDGIFLDFRTGDGSDVTNTGINVSLTSGGTGAGDVLKGINLALSGTSGTEYGIFFADNNFDTDINATTDLTLGIGGTNELTLTASALSPSTSDGNALGTTSLMWSDLFLASGAVVNFDNGDVTLTHASNTLTLAGGNLDAGDNLIVNIGASGTDFTSGGGLTLAEALVVNDDATFTLAAGEKVLIDASTTASTGTAGALDVNLATTSSQSGIDISAAITDDDATDSVAGIKITGTQNSDDGDNLYGVHVLNLAGSASTGNEYGIYQAGTAWDFGIVAEDAVSFGSTLEVTGITTLTGNLNANGGFDVDDAFVIADGGVLTTSQTANFDGTADFDGNVLIADTDIAFDGASTTFTGTGAFTFSSGGSGDITLNSAGGDVYLSGGDVLIVGGHAGSVAYNVISDSGSSPGSGSIDSDDDLYIEGSLEVDGTIFGALTGNVTGSATDLNCTDCINATEIEDIYVLNTGDTMTGALAIAPTTTGTFLDFQLETEWTTGTLINADYASSTTLTGDVTGLALNFNSNVTGVADGDFTGISVASPALTSSGATTTNYYGLNLTAGALDTTNNTDTTNVNWIGANIVMPAIDTGHANDTTKAYGIRIAPPTVTNGSGTELVYGISVNAAGSSNTISAGYSVGGYESETSASGNITTGYIYRLSEACVGTCIATSGTDGFLALTEVGVGSGTTNLSLTNGFHVKAAVGTITNGLNVEATSGTITTGATITDTTTGILIDQNASKTFTRGIRLDQESAANGGIASTQYGILSTLDNDISTNDLEIVEAESLNLYGIYQTVSKTGTDSGDFDYAGTQTLIGTYSAASNTSSDPDNTGTRLTYGGHFTATGATGGTTAAYGIYATASGADANYGIYVADANSFSIYTADDDVSFNGGNFDWTPASTTSDTFQLTATTHTGTSGVLDLDITTAANPHSGINLDYTYTGGFSGGNTYGYYSTITHSSTDTHNMYGQHFNFVDSTAIANTNVISSAYGNFTGNAAKIGFGYHSNLVSTSTTADSLYGGYFKTSATGNAARTTNYGSISYGQSSSTTSDTVYGLLGYGLSSGSSTSGTKHQIGVYGFGTATDSGSGQTTNSYGGIFNGVSAGSGTKTAYGIYSTASGGDTNYAAYFNNGTVLIAGVLDANGQIDLGDSGDSITLSGTTVSLTSNSAGNDITITPADDLILNIASSTDGIFDINASTHTGTAGVLDIDISSATSSNSGINLSYTGTATGSSTQYGNYNLFTQSGITTGTSITTNFISNYAGITKNSSDTLTTGTLNYYGLYGAASYTDTSATGSDTATRNILGGYFSATGDTNGTGNTYGIYSAASGGDSNYSLYLAGSHPYSLVINNSSLALSGYSNSGIFIGGTATKDGQESYLGLYFTPSISLTTASDGFSEDNAVASAPTFTITRGVTYAGVNSSFRSSPTFTIGAGSTDTTVTTATGFTSRLSSTNAGTGTLTLSNFSHYFVDGDLLFTGVGSGTAVTNLSGFRVENTSNSGTLTSQYGVYIENLTSGTNDYGIYVAGADTYGLWIDSGTSRFDGDIIANLSNATSSTEAVCGTVSSENSTASTLDDCTTSVSADYAEIYPTEENIDYGDVVVASEEILDLEHYAVNENGEVISLGNQKLPKLEKSNTTYQHEVVGIVSNNWSDFSSTGAEAVPDEYNPKPIALSGRVPVKVSTENGPILKGDRLTTSSTPGVAMKATKASRTFAMAFSDYTNEDPNQIGKIMVFVENTWYIGTLASNGSLTVGDIAPNSELDQNLQIANLSVDKFGVLVDSGALDGQILTAEQVQRLVEYEVDQRIAELTAAQNLQNFGQEIDSPVPDNEASGSAEATDSAQLAEETDASLDELNELLSTTNLSLDTLTVSGITNLAQTQVAGTFSQDGTFIIDYGRQINVLANTLYLQNDPYSGNEEGILLDVGNGKLTFDKTGRLKIDSLSAENITTKEITVDTGDANFKTAGSATVSTGLSQITIFTTAVKPEAKILITATTPTGGKQLYVANKAEYEGFTVALDGGSAQNTISFDWLVVNTTVSQAE